MLRRMDMEVKAAEKSLTAQFCGMQASFSRASFP